MRPSASAGSAGSWMRPASNDALADRVRTFCEDLERQPSCQDWQVRQAEHALRIYFANFLKRTDWHTQPSSAVVTEGGLGQVLGSVGLRHK